MIIILIDHKLIEEAKQKLGTENAFIIAEELNLEKFDDKNLKACCCYHEENTPSMIFNPKTNAYHSFCCGRNTDIIDAYMLNGCTYVEAVQKLFDKAKIKYAFGEVGVKTKQRYRYPKLEQNEDKTKVYQYLGLRKISPETIDKADVGQDKNGNIVFNYYDTNDVLTTVKYRPSHKVEKGTGQPKTWSQKDADVTHLLFNMNRVNTQYPLLICEGEIDCLSAIESGYSNAVSIPFGAGNFQWIEENFNFLEQFEQIIICSDKDEAGYKMQKEAVYRLGSWKTKIVVIPDVDFCGRKVKDLNELLYTKGKNVVLETIINAKDTPIDSIRDYADIEDVDFDAIDGIKTNIKPLDKKIMRLFYGTFNIITGVNGSGKSSFLSQLICESLDQDKNVFYYSGELPNFQSKAWVNYIFAGQRNLNEYQSGDTIYWKVTTKAKQKMGEHYRNKLFIYKDGYDHKVSTILKSVEDTIRKEGVKLVIIDNLTSVNLECNENNKFSKQEEFVASLINIATKFNVCVCLVVHPHKIETMRRLTKMDVQGASAIIDLTHRIFSLYRVTAKDKQGEPKRMGKGYIKEPIKYDVLVDILKDRIMGFEGETIELYYDRPSRRFFVDKEHLDKSYAWDENEYNSELPYPPPQLEDKEEEVFGKVVS